MSTNKIGSITFPMGGAGNHLRWLLFLDNKYPSNFCDNTPKSKLEFIQNNVYNQKRTWYNWLGKPGSADAGFEWQFRDILDETISVDHSNYRWEKNPDAKELYLTFDKIDWVFQHYFHINLGLNSTVPDQVKKRLHAWLDEFKFLQNRIHEFPNKKILMAEKLYEKKLDYFLYKETIDFFEFTDLYEDATVVHDLYYQCRIRSAKDFYNYFTGPEFKEYLEIFKDLSNQ